MNRTQYMARNLLKIQLTAIRRAVRQRSRALGHWAAPVRQAGRRTGKTCRFAADALTVSGKN